MENVENILNALLATMPHSRDGGSTTSLNKEELLQFLIANHARRGSTNSYTTTRFDSYHHDILRNQNNFFSFLKDGIIPFITAIIRYILWFSFLSFTSFCMYTIIYMVYMPSPVLQREVYFDYLPYSSSSSSSAHHYEFSTAGVSSPSVGHHRIPNSDVHASGSKSASSSNKVCWKDPFPLDQVDQSVMDDLGNKKPSEKTRTHPRGQPQRNLGIHDFDKKKPFDEHNSEGGRIPNMNPQWPTAILDLYTDYNQWESFIDDDGNNIMSSLQLLNNGGKLLNAYSTFYFDIHITLPQSYMNLNLGMFMVQMELYDEAKVILARSRRPALFPYSSTLVRYIRKLCNIAPLVLGLLPEATTVIINVMDHYGDNRSRPLRFVKIMLMLPMRSSNYADSSCDNSYYHYGQRQQIQIFEAKLVIGRELTNLQLFMKQRFILSMLLGVSFLMILQALLLSILGLGIHRGTVRPNPRTNERRRTWVNNEYYHVVDLDGESFSLRTWDKESLSKDDVWDVQYDEEENSLNDEFWDSLSLDNGENIHHHTRTVVSSGTSSERTSPGLKKSVKSRPMKEIKTTIGHQAKASNKSNNLKSDDANSNTSLDLAEGIKADHTVEAPVASKQSRQPHKRHRRNHKIKSANIKLKRKVSPKHENERLQQILRGQMEPYEIFTGKIDFVTIPSSQRP